MMKPLNIGVAGSGIGLEHIKAFKSLPGSYQVQALSGIDESKGHRLIQELNIPRFVRGFDELCGMDELDVVDICTPTNLHYEQVLQGLAADKHVICEKPVAGSLKEIDHIIQAEAESSKRVMPIFQYRFGHGLQKLKKLVDEGIAGRAYLTTVETSWRRREDYYAVPWRGEWETELGGAALTLAVHAHDALTYILGPAREVFARAKTLVNQIETEDTVVASLEMTDDSLANLAVTTGSAEEISRHRFCFSNLSAESNTAPYHNTGDPWLFSGDTPRIEERIEASLSDFEPLPEYFAGQFYRFHQALEQGNEIPVTLADARISLELVTAIYYSAGTGQGVHLPLDRDNPFYAKWHS
jgi:predicted dehydrogenase